jgi:hypothetical protein
MSGYISEEVEASPAMIDAGLLVVRRFNYELWEARSTEELATFVLAIYKAMSENRDT